VVFEQFFEENAIQRPGAGAKGMLLHLVELAANLFHPVQLF